MMESAWTNLSGISSVKHHQKTTCIKTKSLSASASTPLIDRALQSADRDVRKRKSLPPNEKKVWRNCVVDCLSEHPTVSINSFAKLASETANYAATVVHRSSELHDFSIGRTFITSGKYI